MIEPTEAIYCHDPVSRQMRPLVAIDSGVQQRSWRLGFDLDDADDPDDVVSTMIYALGMRACGLYPTPSVVTRSRSVSVGRNVFPRLRFGLVSRFLAYASG